MNELNEQIEDSNEYLDHQEDQRQEVEEEMRFREWTETYLTGLVEKFLVEYKEVFYEWAKIQYDKEDKNEK